jgi:hypothetical protein
LKKTGGYKGNFGISTTIPLKKNIKNNDNLEITLDSKAKEFIRDIQKNVRWKEKNVNDAHLLPPLYLRRISIVKTKKEKKT